ncbi:MAG: hypothetical protein PF436_01365 [Prolixibacteraceae bacterium]|jgi:lysyl endopeptidase|nr:hypothetical protein [Prolixibacteraceae bacterium]
MRKFLFVILFIIMALSSVAQLSDGGFPLDIPILKSLTQADVVEMPAYEVPQKSATDKNITPFKSITFAHSFDVSFTPKNSGQTFEYNGYRIWQLHVRSEGAKSLNLIFSKYHVPDGARLFLYNPAKTEILGAFTSKNNKPFRKLAVYPLPGDELLLQYEEPLDADFEGDLEIGNINHDFFGVVSAKNSWERRLSGECNIDVNCETTSGLDNQKRAVCRILSKDELGTATLINNTSNDGKPYLISAFHIYDSNERAEITIYDFNYESPFCTGIDGYDNQSISGSTALASFDSLDFMLVELSAVPPASFRPYYIGWDLTNNRPSNTYTLHHPNGDTKKISHDEGVCDSMSFSRSFLNNAHWKVYNWEAGTTEAGSSGACLFNNDKRVVGTLSGGYASCTNKSYDAFSRIDKMWDSYAAQNKQLKKWLDPLNSGTLILDGFDPYEPSAENCTVVSNFTINDSLFLVSKFIDYESVTEIAEQFSQFEYTSVSGVAVGISDYTANSVNPELIVRIYSSEMQPSIAIKQFRFSMLDLTKDAMNFLNFGETIYTEGSFYISIVINNQEDNVILYQSGLRNYANSNSMFVKENGLWRSFSDYNQQEKGSALLMQPLVCGNTFAQDTGSVDNSLKTLKFYPNPVDYYLIVEFKSRYSMDDMDNENAYEVIISDLTGKQVFNEKFLYRNYAEINTQAFIPGIYIVQVLYKKEIFPGKLIVVH